MGKSQSTTKLHSALDRKFARQFPNSFSNIVLIKVCSSTLNHERSKGESKIRALWRTGRERGTKLPLDAAQIAPAALPPDLRIRADRW